MGKFLTVQLQQNAGVAHGTVFTLSQCINFRIVYVHVGRALILNCCSRLCIGLNMQGPRCYML